MEAASFEAWQILQSKGLKTKWEKYRNDLGLKPVKSDKLEQEEKEETLKHAESIHERVLRLQKNG